MNAEELTTDRYPSRAPRAIAENFRKQLYYGTRGFLRDNFLCERHVARLLRNEQLSKAALEARQGEYLLRTLRAAASRIDYYRRFEKQIERLRAAEARHFLMSMLPVVSKDRLLAEREAFYPNAGHLRPWTIVGRTSGTTGSPLDVVRSPSSVVWANAFKKRHWTWSGFKEGMPRAMLRGDMAVPPERATLPVWFYNRYNNQLIISSRHLKPPFLAAIAEELRRFKPYLLEAYPSTAYELARYLEANGETVRIPYVYTGSEALYPHQRALIERSFETTVMDHYGMAERVAYATECEFGSLHLNTDYSFVEIVDDDNRPTVGEGYLVGTTFHNLLMPLIRYRLSDRAMWKRGTCTCGRPYPVIHPVTGKFEDMIWGSDGNPVSPSVITFAFKQMKNIERSQVAQVAPGKWQIRIVAGEGFDPDQATHLVANIKKLVDANLDVSTVMVDDIPRTAAGKYKWIVNEWKDGARDKPAP